MKMSCFKCDYQDNFARDCINIGETQFYSVNNMNRSNGVSDDLVPFGYNSNLRNGSQRCYRCGELGHIARNCSSTNDTRMFIGENTQ